MSLSSNATIWTEQDVSPESRAHASLSPGNAGELLLSLTPPARLATLEDLGLTSALGLPVSPSFGFWTDELNS